VNKKEWEGILLALFEGLFMASVLVQYYDIDNHIERVGTVLKVQMITDIDKSGFYSFHAIYDSANKE
jgi:hypothetical protein